MSTQSNADEAKNLLEKGAEALGNLKDAAREKVIEPVVEAAKDFAGAAREKGGQVVDYGRRAAHASDEWVGSHPYSTAGIAFGAGVLLGVFLTSQIRS